MTRFLLALLVAATLSAADLSGRWTGTFTPEGGNQGPALVVLQHDGDSVTGSAGPDDNDRHEISNGKVVGDKVTFQITNGSLMKFELTLKGDELSGQATRERQGQRQTAQLKLTRKK